MTHLGSSSGLSRGVRRACLYALVLAMGEAGQARAQDDFDVPEQSAEVQQGAMVRVVQQVDQQQAIARTIDQQVFNTFGGREKLRERLEAQLDLRLETVEREFALSPIQERKLRLAGHGDIERFYKEADALTRPQPTRDPGIRSVLLQARQLRARVLDGVLNEGSLFAGTLRNISRDTPKPESSKVADRQGRLQSNTIDWFARNMGRGLALTQEQEEALARLLNDRIHLPRNKTTYLYYYLMLQVGKMDEHALQPIFDEVQWLAFQSFLQAGVARSKQLVRLGYLEEDAEPETEKRAAPEKPAAARATGSGPPAVKNQQN